MLKLEVECKTKFVSVSYIIKVEWKQYVILVKACSVKSPSVVFEQV